MEINPSEVTKILKEQIKNFGDKAEVMLSRYQNQHWGDELTLTLI